MQTDREALAHDELVRRAVRWLRGSRRCEIALPEPVSWVAGEVPDAIGWRMGESIVVEVKVSIEDFRADKRKKWRGGEPCPWEKRPQQRDGLGRLRYYLAEPGVIPADKLPDKWGLLACHRTQIRVIVEAEPWHVVNAVGECDILARRWCWKSTTWDAAQDLLQQERELSYAK